MYRPNRIGPFKLGNLNKALLTDAKADFDTHDQSNLTYGCYSLNTTSGDSFIGEHVVFTDVTGVTLADANQVGIGVQLSALDTERNNFIYGIAGSIAFFETDADELLVEMVIGRLAAAPSAAASIDVPNPIVLPVFLNRWSKGFYASVSTQLITTELDGGSAPSTFFDIAAFWRLSNDDGSQSTINNLHCNIAIQKYTEDLITFDPSR